MNDINYTRNNTPINISTHISSKIVSNISACNNTRENQKVKAKHI